MTLVLGKGMIKGTKSWNGNLRRPLGTQRLEGALKRVGIELQKIAMRSPTDEERGLFARSAVNRFYYATFLTTRDALNSLNPKWAKTSHSDIPNILRTSVANSIAKSVKKQVKQGLLTQGQAKSLNSKLRSASKQASELLDQARVFRVLVDYSADACNVHVEKNLIFVNELSIATAAGWPDRADRLLKEVLRCHRESGNV